mgnify:CR=1 FL=1
MTALEKLKAEKAAREQRAQKELADARATQAKIAQEEQRLARLRQGKIGARADAAGLDAVTLETWQLVCAYLASVGTTDEDLPTWVEVMTEARAEVRQ